MTFHSGGASYRFHKNQGMVRCYNCKGFMKGKYIRNPGGLTQRFYCNGCIERLNLSSFAVDSTTKK